ncbi:unnamed protein product [Spodoptera exigua]|nr:unnamed protein product [Spodoptera exigua]
MMLTRSWKTRILKLRIINCVCFIIALKTIIQFFETCGSYNYTHLPAEVLETQLYKQISPTFITQTSKPECKYDAVLKRKLSINNWEVPKTFDNFSATGLVNGSYIPEHCTPIFSVAIIVAYRNRQRQLDIFLPYMHDFLRNQSIHYRIYVVEQEDEKIFNKGVLYNVGAKVAIRDKFPCLILHDVDLLPLDASNLYACGNEPRHMSASIDKFRFVLPYGDLAGGVLALKSEQFVQVNGFSNRFEGWGGEDDDFSWRISSHKLNIIRYPREMSRYTMLRHPQERKNQQRKTIMKENMRDPAMIVKDGFNSTRYTSMHVKNHRLFTYVGVVM